MRMRSYIIERVTKMGFTERTTYYGDIKLKPKGWKVVREKD